jgi:hypothetical protein
MQKCRLIAALAAAITLASFGALAAPSLGGVQSNVRFPIGDTIYDPCTGEIVDLAGTAHTVLELTLGDNRGSLMFHSNAHESGVGETSGASYTLLENFSDHIEGSFVNGQFTQTTVARNLRLVTAGGGNNLFEFDDTFHVTVNANGDVSVEFDHLTPTGCL